MVDIPGNNTISDIQTMKQSEAEADRINVEIPGIVGFVMKRFDAARIARLPIEKRWIDAYRDYRGTWSPEKRLRSTEKSKVFVKIPKTKALAAYGQVNEILFGSNKFPLAISNNERPEGVAEVAHFDPNGGGTEQSASPPPDFGYAGDGTRPNEQPRGFMGGLVDKFKEGISKFVPGLGTDPSQTNVFPARDTALEMEKTIKGQLTETHASKELRSAILDMAIFGTGIIQGPFSYEEIIPKWEMSTTGTELGKEYRPIKKLSPRIRHNSIWRVYPDPAGIDVDTCEYIIVRHKLNRSQLRGLKRLPLFNKFNIDAVIEAGPNYVRQSYEDQILVDNQYDYSESTRWEVLEYWGVIDKQLAEEAGMDIPDDMDNLDEIQVNVWVCNGEWLRVVVNPFEPSRLPFCSVPYERDPNLFWGIGVPENMNDSTIIMNGHARMAIDNLAYAGNLVFDIDESSLVPGQPMDIYPGKIFRRATGAPGQAVFGVKFPNTANDNMMMFDKFRQFSDEETGIPSYSHGATGVSSTTRTASGMSMLMGAAALNAKTVVKNVDDYLLKPLGEAYYYWNMQFNDDVRIQGDLKVKAMGTEALMQEEVRSQRLLQFIQLSANPTIAPWVNVGEVIKELAYSMDLDPEMIVNDLETAKIHAAMMGTMGQSGMQPPLDGGSTGTGNGNIGPANVQMPGQSGFSGNTGDTGANPQEPTPTA